MHCPSTRPYDELRLMRSFSTFFALVSYSACSMAFVDAGEGPTGSGYAILKTFPFRINVSMSPPPSNVVLRYTVVTRIHSENRPPLFPSLQSNLICSPFSSSLHPGKASLRTLFPLPNNLPFSPASDSVFSAFFPSNLPVFLVI